MRKLFLSVALVATAITFTFAQKDASKWSIAPKAGVTYYRITPNDGYVKDASWGAGLIIERTVNPLFGLGLDLGYLNFNRTSVTGKTIDPTLFASVNVSNLLFPHRQSAKANVYAKLGGGLGFYNNKVGEVKNNDIAPVFTAAIHPEVALSNAVALGLEVGYRFYAKENLGGMASKDRQDDALNALVTLRFNLGSDHVRNMTMSDFYPAPEPVIMQNENDYDDSQLINRLDNIDRQNQDIQNRLSRLENDLRNLKDQPKGTEVNTSFDNIEFEFDSAKLTQGSYATLDQIASILKDNQTWATIKVKGHTDSTGPEAYNQKLSESRANSVKEYLVGQGVSASVISTEGYGESQPIADNSTRDGRQKNRRVEFQVVK